ncbi:unnamed protein product [Ambrosiozyma monospora]|uniref:Unnamed protein product n=1 Tax=Ambrosiozyma monospora TaxID=43982 RepID=A0A9W6YVG5_AMBMO|nr:unnamed protein product [Ambrosiozyma monospora]
MHCIALAGDIQFFTNSETGTTIKRITKVYKIKPVKPVCIQVNQLQFSHSSFEDLIKDLQYLNHDAFATVESIVQQERKERKLILWFATTFKDWTLQIYR